MVITVNRNEVIGECLDGILLIDGVQVCDTSENAFTCISEGKYEIERRRCKQLEHAPFVPIIKVFEEMLPCEQCRQLEYASNDTVLPCYCPQIKVGSGIRNRQDGRILVGTKVVDGVVEHSQEAFDQINERIRKSLARGKSVTVIINGEP